MAALVRCRCGLQFQVKGKSGETTIACPVCRRSILLPPPQAAAADAPSRRRTILVSGAVGIVVLLSFGTVGVLAMRVTRADRSMRRAVVATSVSNPGAEVPSLASSPAPPTVSGRLDSQFLPLGSVSAPAAKQEVRAIPRAKRK